MLKGLSTVQMDGRLGREFKGNSKVSSDSLRINKKCRSAMRQVSKELKGKRQTVTKYFAISVLN